MIYTCTHKCPPNHMYGILSRPKLLLFDPYDHLKEIRLLMQHCFVSNSTWWPLTFKNNTRRSPNYDFHMGICLWSHLCVYLYMYVYTYMGMLVYELRKCLCGRIYTFTCIYVYVTVGIYMYMCTLCLVYCSWGWPDTRPSIALHKVIHCNSANNIIL